MNEEIKRKADELVESFTTLASTWEEDADIKCAILSTKHTIEVLEEFELNHNILIKIDEQTSLLNELKSRI